MVSVRRFLLFKALYLCLIIQAYIGTQLFIHGRCLFVLDKAHYVILFDVADGLYKIIIMCKCVELC